MKSKSISRGARRRFTRHAAATCANLFLAAFIGKDNHPEQIKPEELERGGTKACRTFALAAFDTLDRCPRMFETVSGLKGYRVVEEINEIASDLSTDENSGYTSTGFIATRLGYLEVSLSRGGYSAMGWLTDEIRRLRHRKHAVDVQPLVSKLSEACTGALKSPEGSAAEACPAAA